jgi:hypothetical protein
MGTQIDQSAGRRMILAIRTAPDEMVKDAEQCDKRTESQSMNNESSPAPQDNLH